MKGEKMAYKNPDDQRRFQREWGAATDAAGKKGDAAGWQVWLLPCKQRPKEDSARIEADNIKQDQYLKQKRWYMPNVPLEKMLDKTNNSIYKLVIVASKRALEIAEGQPKMVVAEASVKPSTVALMEIAAGKLTYRKIK